MVSTIAIVLGAILAALNIFEKVRGLRRRQSTIERLLIETIGLLTDIRALLR